MLTQTKHLIGCTVHATDGVIGTVATLYFDDDRWTVRYFVVDTGRWLPGRKVLVSPFSIYQVSRHRDSVDVSLTREQVKNSPDVDTERPISRQHEMAYSDYYGYPYYWTGPGVWGAAPVPVWPAVPPDAGRRAVAEWREERRMHDDRNSHLRDVREVKGYHILAADGTIGHAEELLVEDRNWTIRYLVVDTSNWIGGRRVLIAPDWVSAINWETFQIEIALTRDAIRSSPEYAPQREVQRAYEERLYAHYRRRPYWAAPSAADASRPRVARLEQFDDLDVAAGDADVRGWTVVAADGVPVGRVEHLIVDRAAMKVRYLETGLDPRYAGADTRDILVPLEYVDLERSSRRVRLRTLPSTRIPALPPFKGLPIDAEFDTRMRTHFHRGFE